MWRIAGTERIIMIPVMLSCRWDLLGYGIYGMLRAGIIFLFHNFRVAVLKKKAYDNNEEKSCERRKMMLEFRYDTQLLIEGEDLDEDIISEYFTDNFKGDCLLAVGDEELIKIHFHTNEPWKVLEYCSTLGEIYDIVVEDMDRQSRGLQG